MNRITLQFKNPQVETEYHTMKKSFMMKKFYLFYKLQMFYMIIMSIVALIHAFFPLENIMTLIGLFIFIIFTYLLKKLFIKFFEFLIIFIFSIIGLGLVELIQQSQVNCPQESCYGVSAILLMLAFGFYNSISLLTRANWMFSSVIFGGNVFYLLIRVFNSHSSYLMDIIFGAIMLVISFSIVAYFTEMTNRDYFKELRDSNENLKQFKFVLKSVLPSPIFIVNYEDNSMEFLNKFALKLLKKHGKCTTESQDERLKFISSASKIKGTKSHPSNMISRFEEVMDSFQQVQDQRKNEDNEESPSKSIMEKSPKKSRISEIMRKYYVNAVLESKNDGGKHLMTLNDFLTLHVVYQPEKSVEAESSTFGVEEDHLHRVSIPKKLYYELKLSKMTWDGKECLLVIFHDNTSSKQITDLINLDRYKNRMLASISHDLRTPLNGVIGMMNTVLLGIQEKELRRNLLIGIKSANLLNFLINDILDFSQICYKKLRLNFEKIDVKELFNEVYNLLEIQSTLKGLDLRFDPIPLEISRIYSDPTRIKQILLNLLGNAIKFTNKGFVSLKIERYSVETVKFSVEDTGIGIKEEDMGKLFVLFGRLKQGNDTNKTGIGLGLTISNTIAKMLYTGCDKEGIHVESQYGIGTKFWFLIDIGKNNEESSDFDFSYISERVVDYDEALPKNVFTQDSIREIKRILIVDDDPINVMILEKYLEFFKFEHIAANNGLEAVKIIEKEVIEKNTVFSAILMDCNMPVMDGFKATETIIDMLKINKKEEIPIIAVTANVTNADMDLCLKSGMKKFLTKPVSRRDLGIAFENIFKIKLNGE